MADDMAKVIARAWSDPDFKAKLLSDPAAAFSEVGMTVPEGVTLKVVEDTADTRHLVLPDAPADKGDEINMEELEQVAGGTGCFGSNNTLSC